MDRKWRLLWIILSVLSGCGQDDPLQLQGDDAPTISTVSLSPTPTAFEAGSEENRIQGIFLYVDPNADLSKGVSLSRECGQGPEIRQDVPFDQIDPGTTGVFLVSLAVETGCEIGSYSLRFYVIDQRGNRSNIVQIDYALW